MIINNIPNKESSNNRVNTNLLTNGYFANRVNRRGGFCFVPVGTNYYTDSGLTTAGNAITTSTVIGATIDNETYSHYTVSGVDYYVSTADVKYGYYQKGETIDRWELTGNSSLILNEDSITLQSEDNSNVYLINQYDTAMFDGFVGKNVTLSVLLANGKLIEVKGEVPEVSTSEHILALSMSIDDAGSTFRWWRRMDGTDNFELSFSIKVLNMFLSFVPKSIL